MLILYLLKNPIEFLAFIIALFASVSFHEAAHAWMANRLGDPTAKNMGRLSLNPFKHFDPLGTIFFFVAGFGWGIPVPINPRNFRNQKIDSLKVSLAGPLSNLVLALAISLIFRFTSASGALGEILLLIISLNVVWMIFNLLPIPPLDGSHILQLFIPEETYYILQKYGMLILIFLLFFSPYIHNIISTLSSIIVNLLTGIQINPL